MLPDTAAALSKVVILEDSLHIQIALKLLIESVSGFRVVAVESTAATGIDWAKRHPGEWDIAVVDLMLEEGDGFEVIRWFASQPECGHIIVYSAYVTPVIEGHCLELGANAVFPKEAAAKMAKYIENLHSQGC
jgi:two-component system OmpR family response regulator